MPLASLNLANSVNDRMMDVARHPGPLAALEERRAAREKERMERQDVGSRRMSATAQMSQAKEAVTKGQFARNLSRDARAYAEKNPHKPPPNSSQKDYIAGAIRTAQYYQNSPFPSLQTAGNQMMMALGPAQQGLPLDPNTLKGAMAKSTMKYQADMGSAAKTKAAQGTPTKWPEPSADMKTEDDIYKFSDRNILSAFPNIASEKNDSGIYKASKLNQASKNRLQSEFRANYDQATRGLPKNQIPRGFVQSQWDKLVQNYEVIDYDPWGTTNEQVLIPKNIYAKLKQNFPKASDTDIAHAFLMEIGAINE